VLDNSIAVRLAAKPRTDKLDVEELACALYEGTPHVHNLAEKLARQHGEADALTFFDLQGELVKSFWVGIAQQLIDHASQWKKNEGSNCVLSDAEVQRLRELSIKRLEQKV